MDLDYQGGGIGEYQFWDTATESWDGSTCGEHGNGRCAKMDCHLDDTHWQLMGFFKEQYYASEWFEQLFKHSGYCLWDEDTYEFMQENYDNWPEGCSETEIYSESGLPLYLDMKPLEAANMTLALYEDAKCSVEYMQYDNSELEYALAKEGYLTAGYLDTWNDALSVYKYCQPCPASNRNYNNNNNNHRGRRLEDDPNEGYFQCDDAAGYTNVNQCMKFKTKTTMEPATYQNLREAQRQGSLLEVQVADQDSFGVHVETPLSALMVKLKLAKKMQRADRALFWSLITLASCVGILALSVAALCVRRMFSQKQTVYNSNSLSKPLFDDETKAESTS